MAVAVPVGYAAPQIGCFRDSLKSGTANISIAIGLILLMYPPPTKERYEKLPLVWTDLAEVDPDVAAGLVAFNAIFQVLLYSVCARVFFAVLPPLFGFRGAVVDVSIGEIAQRY